MSKKTAKTKKRPAVCGQGRKKPDPGIPGWDDVEPPDAFDWCDHLVRQYQSMLAEWAVHRAAWEKRRKALDELFAPRKPQQ